MVLASLSGSGSGSDKMGAALNQTELTEPPFNWLKTLKGHPHKKEWDGNMDSV